jgi:hypothetical protein
MITGDFLVLMAGHWYPGGTNGMKDAKKEGEWKPVTLRLTFSTEDTNLTGGTERS